MALTFLRSWLALALLLAFSSLPASAQNVADAVIPITRAKPSIPNHALLPVPGISLQFGTGFCLDPACRFIATNYHVAQLLTPRKIQGQQIIRQYLATGPDDRSATLNQISTRLLPYATANDLAVFELRRPLERHSRLAYDLDPLDPGRQVDILGYPLEHAYPLRTLRTLHAVFQADTTSGLLAFHYDPSQGKLHGGASGGIVVDRQTRKVVGVLCGSGSSEEGIALAVPVRALADFLRKANPYLAAQLFPSLAAVPPASADLYPRFIPPAANGGLVRRSPEPESIRLLREKAQQLADRLRNFVAVQSYAWGAGDQQPAHHGEYEVQVLDGVQKFRKYPDGRQFLDAPPIPPLKGWVLPADEWSELPKMVGNELQLKIRQLPDSSVNGSSFHVFQYSSAAEDQLCPFEAVDDFLFFTVARSVPVACFGEVWTDADTNIVRISENLDLSTGAKEFRGWETYRVLVTYGLDDQISGPSDFVPLTIFTASRDRRRMYWCQGQFTRYQRFSASTKLLAASAP